MSQHTSARYSGSEIDLPLSGKGELRLISALKTLKPKVKIIDLPLSGKGELRPSCKNQGCSLGKIIVIDLPLSGKGELRLRNKNIEYKPATSLIDLPLSGKGELRPNISKKIYKLLHPY